MTKHTACIIPHRLNFGPGFAGTPPRAGKEIGHTAWQCKAGTVSELHLGKACKKTIIAHFFEGWDFCKRLADHVLQKSHSAVVHSLMNRFGRHRQMRAALRHFRGQLRQCRGGVTPGPKGDEGQKEFAGHLRCAFDKAGTTRGSFDVV